jgi:hypothetical protein
MSIDPTTMLILLAILFGIIALFIAIIILIIRQGVKDQKQVYHANLIARTIAVVIDISILRLLSEIVWLLLNPSYFSVMLYYLSYLRASFFVIPIFIMPLIGEVISYLIFFNPLLGYGLLPSYFGASFLATLFGFFYFFTFDAFLKGKTPGRFLLRLETRHQSKERYLTKKEAYFNAVGKSFLLFDLILGVIAAVRDPRDDELKQVRFTQRLSGAVTKNAVFKEQETDVVTQPTPHEDDSENKWIGFE